ncbi:MAG: DUF2891 domain-containing protein [Bacteroidota bacterium]
MKIKFISLVMLVLFFGCTNTETKEVTASEENNTTPLVATAPSYTIAEANKLIELPLACVTKEYPNKLGQTIGGDEDLRPPRELHPVFYGCFDWHSAVHGYWSMVTLLKRFPDLAKADEVRSVLQNNITKENIEAEVHYFRGVHNRSFERTYGWAWLLKLSEALHTWDDPMAAELAVILQPLADIIVEKYLEFLPKLVYPIRVGEHTNTAFGLTFAYDYANAVNHTLLRSLIEQRAKDFYSSDANCPLGWEPSGYDFLSPCLEEIDIMRRVLTPTEFATWLRQFMPEITEPSFTMAVGKVSDRTDGKLVHLDGLNFSRAWVLYGLAGKIPELYHLEDLAHVHVAYSYPNLVADSYEGGHWLGSFAIYALENYIP